MCKSRAEGGQRCAAHTRAKFEATREWDENWDQVAAEYASTKEGEQRLTERAHEAADIGDYETEARYNAAVMRGINLRHANNTAATEIARADRRNALINQWRRTGVGEPAPKDARLTDQDWADLQANPHDPHNAAMIVAARTCDPDIGTRPEFPGIEEQALGTLANTDPGALTRSERTMVVTASMRLTMIDGEPVDPPTDPLAEQRGAVAHHILDWTRYNGL